MRITDPAARVYGFQMSARPASNTTNGQAGSFVPGSGMKVICANDADRPASGSCPSTAAVEFIEHSTPNNTNTFTFEWVAPTTDIGNVEVYFAANAANGDGTNIGDQIYTNHATLTPGQASSGPVIRSEQPVLQAFDNSSRASSGTWLQIFGENLSATERSWAGTDFNGNQAPTALDGVSVNVNGKSAYVSYVSRTQVNALAPDDEATGPVNLQITNSNGTSNSVSITKTKVSPALLTTPAFLVGGKQYVAALHADNATFVGPTNLIPGVAFRPAKPNDIIIIYAVGCGSTNPPAPAGQVQSAALPLASPYEVRIGQVVAPTQAFLAAGSLGLCQFNVTIPSLAPGDHALSATVDGVATGQSLFTTVGE